MALGTKCLKNHPRSGTNAMTERLRLPDLLVLGTQKGGTSSLRRLLLDHPQLFMAATKEVHFFSKNWDRSIDWYARHFSNAPEGVYCGESTPFYLFHQEAPQRIHNLIPQVKLIVLLRDPVERALSQYFHSVRLGLETLPRCAPRRRSASSWRRTPRRYRRHVLRRVARHVGRRVARRHLGRVL